MKLAFARCGKNDVQLIWLGAVLTMVAGYFFVFRTLETQIADRYEATQSVYAALEHNATILRERPILERRRREADLHLQGLNLEADRPAAVAAFVREIAHISLSHRVRVTAIDAPRIDTSLTTDRETLDPIALDVTIVGTYRDLLATIRDLSRGRSLAQIDISAIERISTRTGGGGLAAKLRINIEHLREATTPVPSLLGGAHVFARP